MPIPVLCWNGIPTGTTEFSLHYPPNIKNRAETVPLCFLLCTGGLRGVGPPGEIVQCYPVIIRQLHRPVQRQQPFAPLLFGIEGLVTVQVGGNLLLGEVPVLPQVPDAQFHLSSPVPL